MRGRRESEKWCAEKVKGFSREITQSSAGVEELESLLCETEQGSAKVLFVVQTHNERRLAQYFVNWCMRMKVVQLCCNT